MNSKRSRKNRNYLAVGFDSDQFAFQRTGQPSKDCRRVGQQSFVAIIRRNDDGGGKRQSAEILLKLDILIDGEKRVEFKSRLPQEPSIIQCRPTHLVSRSNFVAQQYTAKAPRNTVIQQNLHLKTSSNWMPAACKTPVACSLVTPGKSFTSISVIALRWRWFVKNSRKRFHSVLQ